MRIGVWIFYRKMQTLQHIRRIVKRIGQFFSFLVLQVRIRLSDWRILCCKTANCLEKGTICWLNPNRSDQPDCSLKKLLGLSSTNVQTSWIAMSRTKGLPLFIKLDQEDDDDFVCCGFGRQLVSAHYQLATAHY